MTDQIQLGDISIAVTRKAIKNVHLSVYPPDGRVTLSAPAGTRPEVARAYAITKLGWIREQQAKLRNQARETPRRFVERESHFLWGRRHLMTVVEQDAKPVAAFSGDFHAGAFVAWPVRGLAVLIFPTVCAVSSAVQILVVSNLNSPEHDS